MSRISWYNWKFPLWHQCTVPFLLLLTSFSNFMCWLCTTKLHPNCQTTTIAHPFPNVSKESPDMTPLNFNRVTWLLLNCGYGRRINLISFSSVQLSLRLDQMLVLQIWNQIWNEKWDIMILYRRIIELLLKKRRMATGQQPTMKKQYVPNN